MNTLRAIFRENKFRPDDLPNFESKLFFEGERRQPYLVKFFVLLFLATVIAAYGVLNDSAATVIGAMIIAPLMTPIMATAAALVMGDHQRGIRSLLVAGEGELPPIPDLEDTLSDRAPTSNKYIMQIVPIDIEEIHLNRQE